MRIKELNCVLLWLLVVLVKRKGSPIKNSLDPKLGDNT